MEARGAGEAGVEAGAPLLRAGERDAWSFFICRGLVRELYVGERGEARTRGSGGVRLYSVADADAQ